jgi:peptidoglycan/xylan/chitin deacetylase (PgdA/CDA1 family)
MTNSPNVPVLMYHHVTPAGGMIATTPSVFAEQIARLAQAGYTSLTAAQFAAYLAGAKVPVKSVLITFDDGYLNNWVHAHPILQRHGMHAVLFVVTSWVGEGLVRPYAGQPGAQLACPDHVESKRLIAQGHSDLVMLRWSELQAMEKAGTFEIHSHTHTHTRWDQECAQDPQAKRMRIMQELHHSREALARHGMASEHLCWPQGYFDNDYVEAARAAGFSYFYTTDAYGQNRPGGNPQHIYRFAVSNCAGSWLNRRIWLARSPLCGPSYHAWKAWKKRLRNRL